MGQQNVVGTGDGAELVESFPSQTGSPGFNPRHQIKWIWWSLFAIPAPWGGKSRRIRSSRAYSPTQGAWYQPGLETLSQKNKNKKMAVMCYGILRSRFWVPKNVCTFYFYGKWNRTDTKAHRIPPTQYPQKGKTKRHITGGCLDLVGLGIRQTIVATGFFWGQQNVLVSGNDSYTV